MFGKKKTLAPHQGVSVLPRATMQVARSSAPVRRARAAVRKAVWSACAIESEHMTSEQQNLDREGIILDLSKRGVRIRFQNKSALPQQVSIRSSRLGIERRAKVVWQDEFDAGLEFVPDRAPHTH